MLFINQYVASQKGQIATIIKMGRSNASKYFWGCSDEHLHPSGVIEYPCR